jgi:membrane-anchored protein YejM (alkaline phosphatase superfamily)
VGANTWFLKLRDEIDAEVHAFIDLQHGDYDVEWINEELNVVTPETVTKITKKIAEQYPNKRLIVHYLQPHHPFIGPTGRDIFDHQSQSLTDVVSKATDHASDKDLREAYQENVDIVIDEVKKLLPTLNGKTVVTADHGEMLGDRHDFIPTKDYGHHKGIFNNSTVGVPWHIVEHSSRKDIVSEPPEREPVDIDRIDQQLRDLGYKI